MGEIRCGKRRILSAFALHKNSAFEIHTTKMNLCLHLNLYYGIIRACFPSGSGLKPTA